MRLDRGVAEARHAVVVVALALRRATGLPVLAFVRSGHRARPQRALLVHSVTSDPRMVSSPFEVVSFACGVRSDRSLAVIVEPLPF